MESGALSTDEFKDFGKDVVLFTHITSRLSDAEYPNLLMEKGGRGFPHLAVLDAEGDVIANPAGRDVEAFRKAIEAGEHYVTLRNKKELTTEDRIELFGLEIGLGKYDFAQAQQKVSEMGELDAEQTRMVKQALLPLEIQANLPKDRNPETQVACGKVFLTMMKEGREPEGATQVAGAFYSLILEAAYAEKDAAAFEQALAEMRERFDNPRAAAYFENQEKRLEELKSGGDDDE